jgi:hypothetical protein
MSINFNTLKERDILPEYKPEQKERDILPEYIPEEKERDDLEEMPPLDESAKCVDSLSSTFFENYKYLRMYALCQICSTLSLVTRRKRAFGENLSFKTINCGKKKDMPRFCEEASFPEFIELASQRGYNTKQPIELDPFGVCAGDSFLLCKEWLETHNFDALAEKFQDGAPYEAVALQACYESLPLDYSNFYYVPLYNHLQEMFDKLYLIWGFDYSQEKLCVVVDGIKRGAEENPDISNSDECLWIIEATENFLSENLNITEYLLFVRDYVQAKYNHKFEIPDLFFNAALQIVCGHGMQLCHEETLKAKRLNKIRTTCASIGCTATTQLNDVNSPNDVIASNPSHWEDGAYFCSTPVYSPVGTILGAHAFVFIKESDSIFYLVDPNIGGKKIKTPEKALSKLYKFYCGEFLNEPVQNFAEKVSRIALRIKNICLLQCSAPMFTPLQAYFRVYRIALKKD